MTPGLLEPATPPPPPLYVTPSGYAQLKECPLRFAWQSSDEPPRLPSGPAAHLGTVAHKVFERAASGRVEVGPDGGRRAWAEAVEAEHRVMAADWLERPFVPLQRSAYRYEEVRLATTRRVTRLVPPVPRAEAVRRDVEPPMVTPDGLVRGRSDVIVETAAGAIIRDYKTGELFDRGPPRQLKPAYRDQMLLYAAVYHAIHRAWPISLELVPLTGQSVEVPHTPEIVEHALSDAVDRLSALRTALSAKLSLETIAIAGEHCGHCAYRPVCPKHPPVGGMLEDLSGGFQYARSSRPGVVALTLLSTPKPLVITGVSENRNRNPALDLLQEGDTVFAFNVRKLSDLIYVATDYTVLYKGS